MASKRKKRKSKHAAFEDSYTLHDSVGGFDGGSCLSGHQSKWKERDSCSYRWQGIRQAKDNPGPYNSYRNASNEPIHQVDGTSIRWIAVSSIAKGNAGKIMEKMEQDIKNKVLKNKIGIKNFTTGYVPYGNQVHHVLPFEQLQNAILEACKPLPDLVKTVGDGLLEEQYNINFKVNMLILPTNWKDACVIGLPTHCGSHPTYSGEVKTKVDKALLPYKSAAAKGEEHPAVDPADLKEQLQDGISKPMYGSIVSYGQSKIKAQCAQAEVSVNKLPKLVYAVMKV